MSSGATSSGTSRETSARPARTTNRHWQARHRRGIAFNLGVLGLVHILADEYDQAVDRCTRAGTVLEGIQDEEIEGLVPYRLATAYSHLRDFPGAVRTFRRATALNRVAGNRHSEAVLLADLATTLADAGHPTIACSIWRTAFVTLTEFGDPRAQDVLARVTNAGGRSPR